MFRRWVCAHRGEIALAVVALTSSAATAELAGRWLDARELGLPLFHSAEERFYPTLALGLRRYSPEERNVLLLGGSVLQRIPGEVWRRMGPEWRFYDVSFKAHTTLDSLYKLEWLLGRGYRFEYVVLYHGINEVRTNNVPPELFAVDYSHYAFYRMAHLLFRDRRTLASTIVRHSDLAYRAALAYHTRSGQGDLLPPDNPPKEWKPYGADVKSARSFRRNLVRIAELARQAGSTLVVPRFAYASPPDYSLAAWRDRTLGFTCAERGDPTHIWGVPEHVPPGIEAHNHVIDEERDRFVLVDTGPLMGNVDDFCDICHFSPRGMERFVQLVLRSMREAWQGRAGARPQ
jgi:hypothetical protein